MQGEVGCMWVLLALSAALTVYLTYVIFHPEKF
ncbi:K(+)-transporting ATPase subunit F [Alicyclobacillus curvatus]|nr:K(+)-transporting ATPase subunit F [Alicyclobacillus curvatus]QSO52897.1 K(+)-transporting ATPase subunit F [Alicyclobacillus curvatus]